MSPKFIREGFDLCQCARDLVFREAGIQRTDEERPSFGSFGKPSVAVQRLTIPPREQRGFFA